MTELESSEGEMGVEVRECCVDAEGCWDVCELCTGAEPDTGDGRLGG